MSICQQMSTKESSQLSFLSAGITILSFAFPALSLKPKAFYTWVSTAPECQPQADFQTVDCCSSVPVSSLLESLLWKPQLSADLTCAELFSPSRLCEPKPTDVIVDPMCGTGAIPIEVITPLFLHKQVVISCISNSPVPHNSRVTLVFWLTGELEMMAQPLD